MVAQMKKPLRKLRKPKGKGKIPLSTLRKAVKTVMERK
jgi:hypothetical protein